MEIMNAANTNCSPGTFSGKNDGCDLIVTVGSERYPYYGAYKSYNWLRGQKSEPVLSLEDRLNNAAYRSWITWRNVGGSAPRGTFLIK